jgi:asparagine synthase (glutamine-hydrolysing)
MMLRYLVLFCDANNAEHVEALRSFRVLLEIHAADWSTAYSGPGAVVLYKSTMPEALDVHSLQDDSGVVLGAVFKRNDGDGHIPLKADFSADDSKSILATGGRTLVDRYFGSYLAFLRDRSRDRDLVFCEPMGNMPCYRTARNGVNIFFSHAEDCARCLHLDFEVNSAHLTRWLVFSGLHASNCSLKHVEKVLAGERLTFFRGNIGRDRIWSPMNFATMTFAGGPAEATKSLRQAVQGAVDTWASRYSIITHKLSGGLDSAIVAGCLAHTPSAPKVTYLNLTAGELGEHMHFPSIPDKDQARVRALTQPGDERVFARLVAKRWGVPLFEHQRNRAMDLRALSLAPLSADPALYFAVMDVDEIEVAHATPTGTQAFFSGQNGDELFMATRQPFLAIDHAYLHGLSGLMGRASTAARTSGRSFWSVLRQSLWNGMLKRPYRQGNSCLQWPSLMPTNTLLALKAEDFESPFEGMLAGLPPGKQYHAMGTGVAAYYNYVFKGGHLADYVDPLNSQPVWELMLQFPTEYIALNGVSRGLARRAFEDVLPEQIRKRQVKGVGSAFYQDVVNRNRDAIKDRLLQGHLVREGYLDRRKADDCLSATYPSATHTASTILTYLSAENWMERLTELRRSNAAPAAVAPRSYSPADAA